MSLTDIDPLLGRSLAGKFELRELLGVGAMGKVYRAHHLGLDKPVAIKVLIRVPAVQEAQARRFAREARAASRLEHPNTVRILDFGEEQDGLLYIAMEYLEGIDLQELITVHGPLPTERVAWIMSQSFAALAAAHAAQVIHRDVKPGNIMLVQKTSEDGPIDDFVKVCDFGLAKIVAPDASFTDSPLTAQGSVFGTPAYMSPEQARGLDLDPRSDIYSCGVVMYKMLVGHTPFRAENPTGVLLGHIHEPPPPLRTWGLPVHPELARIVERAMQKDPAARYQSAKEARDDLRALLEEAGWSRPPATGSAPTPVTTPPRAATDVPTEQVRLRNDQTPTAPDPDPDPDRTVLDSPPRFEEPTRFEDTRPPPTVAAPPPSAAPSTPPPPRAGAGPGMPWWAILPGALALVAAVALLVVLVSRDRAAAIDAPRSPLAAQALPVGFTLDLTLTDVEREGIAASPASQAALTRHLEDARACLRPRLAEARGPASGALAVSAQVTKDGRLDDVTAAGLPGASACVKDAFAMARLPREDSSVRLRFVLRYRAVAP